MRKKENGFTLIELMVTIAVLAVLATMAAPSMSNMMEKQKFNKDERELISQLVQAKSQASVTKKNITLDIDSTSANTNTSMNWKKKSESILTIQTLSDTQALGTYSGTSLIFDKNGTVSSLTQDAIISLCNSKLKIKKQIILTKLGAVYSKPEGVC